MTLTGFAKQKGFTLVEMALVAVVIGIILFGAMNFVTERAEQSRIDRSSLQMQQILNAALAYYLANNAWPASLECLQGDNSSTSCATQYIPTVFNSPWGANPYTAKECSYNATLFCVSVATSGTGFGTRTGAANAQALAGTLPMATVNGTTVEASINTPGQNLNNARAVNFAGLYHHGGCVPVPQCPVDTNGIPMVPQIMVAPVQVSGVYDNNSNNVYPISSFTAYATGNANPPNNTNPPACSNSTFSSCAPTIGNATAYWRVCLQVVTEMGEVGGHNTSDWGQYVTLLAITRCAVNNEASGSTFAVYGN